MRVVMMVANAATLAYNSKAMVHWSLQDRMKGWVKCGKKLLRR